MSTPALLYTEEKVETLYESMELGRAVASLEETCNAEDAPELSNSVNPSVSRNEPVSRWVRYREAYAPKIVEHLIDRFPLQESSGYIFDPMCGSGSTQQGAQSLGYASAGTDVNPYAVLVSQSKTRARSAQQLKRIGSSVLGPSFRCPVFKGKLNKRDAYLTRYFPEENLRALIGIRSWIQREFEQDPPLLDFVKVALLAIVEQCSNRRKDGNGLATRPSPVSNPHEIFQRQLDLMVEDCQVRNHDLPLAGTYLISALEADKAISIANQTLKRDLGAIIFSPPYANSFDYFESYKLELLFGRFYEFEQLPAARSSLIRNYRQCGSIGGRSSNHLLEILIDEIMMRIPFKERRTGVIDGRSRLLPNMLRGYFEDMATFLRKTSSIMPTGSRMHIVIDQSAYLGVPVPTDLLLAELAMTHDLSVEKLLVCRPAKTSAQQLSLQPMLKETLRESVLTLRK